jgi:hypothetical protein
MEAIKDLIINNRASIEENGVLGDMLNLDSRKTKKVRREIEDAGGIENHIIVFGCVDHLVKFIAELRRQSIMSSVLTQHPIVVVSSEVPPDWVWDVVCCRLLYTIIYK